MDREVDVSPEHIKSLAFEWGSSSSSFRQGLRRRANSSMICPWADISYSSRPSRIKKVVPKESKSSLSSSRTRLMEVVTSINSILLLSSSFKLSAPKCAAPKPLSYKGDTRASPSPNPQYKSSKKHVRTPQHSGLSTPPNKACISYSAL
jgi:hypothetical protein